LGKIEFIGTLLSLLFGVYWFFNPESNIEPLIVVIAAATALYSFLTRKYKLPELVQKILRKPRVFEILVDRNGRCTQSKEELQVIIDETINRIQKGREYEICVNNSDFSTILKHDDDGIRGALSEDLSIKLNETSKLIDLLINSWVKGLILDASKDDLLQMVSGALKIATLDKMLDPFKEYLDIWFNQNTEFRSLAHLDHSQSSILFNHLGVSNTMQIMGGSILELPKEILFSEVIPKVYYALQKNADKRNFESMDSLFDLSYWSYGAG